MHVINEYVGRRTYEQCSIIIHMGQTAIFNVDIYIYMNMYMYMRMYMYM